jgi:hypothetical protein
MVETRGLELCVHDVEELADRFEGGIPMGGHKKAPVS